MIIGSEEEKDTFALLQQVRGTLSMYQGCRDTFQVGGSEILCLTSEFQPWVKFLQR